MGDTSHAGMLYRQELERRGVPLNAENLRRLVEESRRTPPQLSSVATEQPMNLINDLRVQGYDDGQGAAAPQAARAQPLPTPPMPPPNYPPGDNLTMPREMSDPGYTPMVGARPPGPGAQPNYQLEFIRKLLAGPQAQTPMNGGQSLLGGPQAQQMLGAPQAQPMPEVSASTPPGAQSLLEGASSIPRLPGRPSPAQIGNDVRLGLPAPPAQGLISGPSPQGQLTGPATQGQISGPPEQARLPAPAQKAMIPSRTASGETIALPDRSPPKIPAIEMIDGMPPDRTSTFTPKPAAKGDPVQIDKPMSVKEFEQQRRSGGVGKRVGGGVAGGGKAGAVARGIAGAINLFR